MTHTNLEAAAGHRSGEAILAADEVNILGCLGAAVMMR